MMSEQSFASPGFFWLLIIIPLMVLWYIIKEKSAVPFLRMPGMLWFEKASGTFRYYLNHALFILRLAAIALLIVVLARPQFLDQWEEIETEGIDIMIALDISSSMLAEDFKPNRMESAKSIATDFIRERVNDRIGLVIFSGESFTQCPLTTDHEVLIDMLNDVRIGMIEDGTAIGMGLATAVNRLRDSESDSRIVILLTDGVNNRGSIDPITAGNIASSFGIRVYTVGVGSRGEAPFPVQTPSGVNYQMIEADIDEDVLVEIAEITGGRYYRAIDEESLYEIYSDIDQLEKSLIEVAQFSKTSENYRSFAFLAGLLLILEWLLKVLIVRRFP